MKGELDMRKLEIFSKINFPLLVGLCIVLLIAAVSFYPEQFATSDPYGKETFQYGGSGSVVIPPIPPGKEYRWGTDEKGRDLRSLIIYGTYATMSMALGVAAVRLIIALPLAVLAAYKNKLASLVINGFNTIFGAFPLIVVIMLLTRVDLFIDIFPSPMLAAILIMSALGWGKLAKLLTKSVEDILNQDFIEGEIAIGKTKLGIAVQNVIPHIIPSIAVLFCLEIAAVLLLLSQVGVLGLLLSGGYTNTNKMDAGFGNLRVPNEFDWASLLVFSHYLFNSAKMWLIIYPAAAFALSIIGFNLLGEGINIEFEKRDSRVFTFIKSVPGIISPLRLIYEVKNLNTYRRNVCIKAAVLLLVLLVAFFSRTQSEYEFDSVTAFKTVRDIGSTDFKYREYKADINIIATDYLADKLEQYGIQPFDNKYVHEMLTEDELEIAGAELVVNTKNGSKEPLIYKQDFILAEPVEAEGVFPIVQFPASAFKDIRSNNNLGDQYRDSVLLIDTRGMDYRDFLYIMLGVKYDLKPRGLIIIEDWNSTEGRGGKRIYLSEMGSVFTVLAAGDKGDELLRQKEAKLSVDIDVEKTKHVLNANVMGVIPGKDPVLKNEIIIIGTSISSIISDMGKGNHVALSTGGIAIELELARMLGQMEQKPDRTVILAFRDDSQKFTKGAKLFSEQYIDSSKNTVFYVDIGQLNRDVLIVDSSGIKPKDKKVQGYIKGLKSKIEGNNIDAVFRPINNSAIGTFISNKQEVLAFDSENPKYIKESRRKKLTDKLTREDLVKFHNIGQMIIDAVFDLAYDK